MFGWATLFGRRFLDFSESLDICFQIVVDEFHACSVALGWDFLQRLSRVESLHVEDEFNGLPDRVGDVGGHGGGHAERFVDATEIVVSEVEVAADWGRVWCKF